MDLKKEIKFSDLVPRRRKAAAAGEDAPPKEEAKKTKLPKKPLMKRELSLKRKPKPKAIPGQQDASKNGRKSSSHKSAKRVVGLKIGASQLAAARVVNNGSPELVQVARKELEPGLVVAGELREPELLADALRSFFREHKLPRQGVRLGIASNRIGVRSFEIAGITDPRQLENAVRFRAQEVLPIPLEEAVLDYQVLGERVDEEGNKLVRILLVVAYREQIDRYVSACKKAGLRLTGIDLEAFALLRALAEPPAAGEPGTEAALVVVSIGHDRSTFAVSDGRICEFTRVLEWGGATLDVAIARELDVAPSEAEPIKRTLSLASANVPEGITAEQAEAAREAVRRQ